VEETRTLGLASFPGAYTATEVVAAWRAGADAVKIFPANGPEYIRALKAPLPQIRFIPTGGITPANAAEFIASGAWALGVASELVSAKEIATVDAATLTARAASFTAALQGSQNA
jgi:2-dehydro-3-deoxyphosphogluconate aldolase/(4S)-4-hydroxy-2-oxoglutarate aldolase